MYTATFEIERACRKQYRIILGVDEAGRGPLAGPVVAAAALYKRPDFIIPEEHNQKFLLVRDSKTLSPKQREKIFDFIHEHFFVGVGLASPETIDRMNILEATFLAMKMAVAQLRRANKKVRDAASLLVLVDGNRDIPNVSFDQEAIIDGDRLSASIAAASIVAKVTRDRLMIDLDKKYPAYGFVRHKGYGTQEHMRSLERYGPTPQHRQSFAPVQQAIIRFRELGLIS